MRRRWHAQASLLRFNIGTAKSLCVQKHHLVHRRSSVVHAAIMGDQSFTDTGERGHLTGEVPALLLMAISFATLMLRTGRDKLEYDRCYVRFWP